MDNRVYYGEYSLTHWIDLILKENIVLPKYQRYFVWDENKVRTLIKTFKKRQFVPPVTIGAFKNADINQNLILDGQQRLTSILLAYLGLYPDVTTYKRMIEKFADENDEEDENEQLDNIIEWTFKILTEKGKNKQDILSKIIDGNYKIIDVDVDEDFFKNTFLGFSYMVPSIDSDKIQQKYYSSVFRNINIQGESLLPQESRGSLYFLDDDLNRFFDPEFCKTIIIKNLNNEARLDFVRYLSLLSQFYKDERANNIARGKGSKAKMEKYYEEYIYSIVGEDTSETFADFSDIFNEREYDVRFDSLKNYMDLVEFKRQFISIIDLDLYFFGMMYEIIFENKRIDVRRNDELKQELDAKITELRGEASHVRTPSALKHLRCRISSSIEIYKKYEE